MSTNYLTWICNITQPLSTGPFKTYTFLSGWVQLIKNLFYIKWSRLVTIWKPKWNSGHHSKTSLVKKARPFIMVKCWILVPNIWNTDTDLPDFESVWILNVSGFWMCPNFECVWISYVTIWIPNLHISMNKIYFS
jgi:hypothetical protein